MEKIRSAQFNKMRYVKSVVIALVVFALELVSGFATFFNTRSVTYNDIRADYRNELSAAESEFVVALSSLREETEEGDFSSCLPLSAVLKNDETSLRYTVGENEPEIIGAPLDSVTLENLRSDEICFYALSVLGISSVATADEGGACAVLGVKDQEKITLRFAPVEELFNAVNLSSFAGGAVILSAGGNAVYSTDEVASVSLEKLGNGWLRSLHENGEYYATVNGEVKDHYFLLFKTLSDTGYYIVGCADFRAAKARLNAITGTTVAVFSVTAFFVEFAVILGLFWANVREDGYFFSYRILTNADGVILKADKKFRERFPGVKEISENTSRFSENVLNTIGISSDGKEKVLVCTVRFRSNGTVLIYADEVDEKQVEELGEERSQSMSDVYNVFSHIGDRVFVGCIFLGNLYNLKTMFGDDFVTSVRDILLTKIRKKFAHVYALDYYNIGVIQQDGKPLDNLLQDLPDIVSFVNQPVKIEDNLVMVGVKCGFAISDASMKDRSYRYVMTAVNAALTRARKEPLKEYYVYHESQKRQYQKSFMKFDIRRMLENGDFELEYQPQYSLKKDRIVGFESLFRVKKRAELNVDTYELISYAERSGDMVLLGNFIFDTGMRFAKRIEGMGVSISLNVSPIQLMQEGFVDNFLNIFRKYDLKPGAISVEITESFLMSTFDETVKKLDILVRNGIDVHLDDFGTMYSSLQYLKKLPISTIKVDRSFIMDITENEYSRTITKFVLDLSHSLKLKNICEGVETWGQLEALRQLGGEVIQGFIIGKSQTEENAYRMIDSFRLLPPEPIPSKDPDSEKPDSEK